MTEIYLVYSGSYNPIHDGHLEVIIKVKEFMTNKGYIIKKAFVAPSSDSYIKYKLGKHGIKLEHRVNMCKLATHSYDWISVCDYGLSSGGDTGLLLRKRNQIPNEATIFEVGGADFGLNSTPWKRDKNFICVGRKPFTDKIKTELKNSKLKINSNFILIEDEVKDVSSTEIRHKFANGEKLSGMLNEEVIRYFTKKQKDLYLLS